MNLPKSLWQECAHYSPFLQMNKITAVAFTPKRMNKNVQSKIFVYYFLHDEGLSGKKIGSLAQG